MIIPNRKVIFLPALLLTYFIIIEVKKLEVYITSGTIATYLL